MKVNLTLKKEAGEYCSVIDRLYQRATNPKLGLLRVTELIRRVDVDMSSMLVVQIVGTNGKGSTSAFVEAILRSNRISTGLFTSPHLSCVRERIRIDGTMVSEDNFVDAAKMVLRHAEEMDDAPSFFECILVMALLLFKARGVRVAILEAGLGGRLDATTAIAATILGVCMIDFDHQHILGDTIEEIAREKMSAARPSQAVISVRQAPKVLAIFDEMKESVGFQLSYAPLCEKPLGLVGIHQKINAGLALALVRHLPIKTTDALNSQGLLSVNWPGRFEIVERDGVEIVLDGAHNPSGLRVLIDSLRLHPCFNNSPLVLLYGSLKSKNLEEKTAALVSSGLDIKAIMVHEPKNPRAATMIELVDKFIELGVPADKIYKFDEWKNVISLAKKYRAAIVVTGSLYTIGAIRTKLFDLASDDKHPEF